MIHFILNDKEVTTELPAGCVLLDFIRYHKHLSGTKIGCREGDCGACTVMVGELIDDTVRYRSVTSCLYPLGKAQGKHIVTIEGINCDTLTPVQQSMADESATQCGFCTTGFVVSLTTYAMQAKESDPDAARACIDGNICRCTGYKSIERAVGSIDKLIAKNTSSDSMDFAISKKIIPAYFRDIADRLLKIQRSNEQVVNSGLTMGSVIVGGGTDLYVQKHDTMPDQAVQFSEHLLDGHLIAEEGDQIIIHGAATISDLAESALFNKYFPELAKTIKLVSSTPIRNMATLAGNFVNASPIGDFTIFFLALDTQLELKDGSKTRHLPLRNFYKGYKTLNKQNLETISAIRLRKPGKDSRFNFEKVSKRTCLDIASVNSSCSITVKDKIIREAHLSAGGIGPIPSYLQKTSEWLIGKETNETIADEAFEVALTEISPISDARGSAAYKKLLLRQMIRSHFITLCPELKSSLINTKGK